MAHLRSACYLRSLAQSATTSLSFKISVDSTLLEPGVGYSVGLELTNEFAQRSVLIEDVQVRSLPGLSVFVVGGRYLEVTRVGEPIALQVDSTVSCSDQIGTQVGYVWSASSAVLGAASSAYTLADLNRSNIAKNPRVFRIARTALDAEKSYRFRVEAYMINNSKASNSSAVITANVSSSALIAAITGGSRAIGERDALVLNGTSSFDPDLSASPFVFTWACADLTNASLAQPQSCINASASSVNSLVPLDLSSSSKGALLTLAPFSLQQNRTLIFTITVSKTSPSGTIRTWNTSTTVWTLLGSVPEVDATASSAKVLASSRVALLAQVKSTYPYTARWVQVQGDLVLPDNTVAPNATATNDAFALPLTSLNNVIHKNKLASELAAAPPTVALEDTTHRKYSMTSSTLPAVSSASKLASPNTPTDAVLPSQRQKTLSTNRGVRTSLDDGDGDGQHEEIASVPYPASIVYVVFVLCGVWIGVMAYLIVHSSMELGKTTAWRCVICWCVGLGFHFLIVEPGVIFAQIVWSTLGTWWSDTWLVRLIRYGREALRIKPDAATAAARYYASLSLYERIRFNAAVRIQRRLLTRVTRRRYLQLVRERRRESHCTLAEQCRLTVKKAIEGFTEEEVRAFSIIFQDADPAKLGLVSHTVISQSIYQLGVRVASELVFKFLYDLDPAYADLVDFEHFLYGMHCVRMHHQEEQQAHAQALVAQTDADAAEKQNARGAKEEFVSSPARFGPAADPPSKIFVKRQNLLRELKEKRESLSYKLMSKVGKLPPILQRGESSKTNLLPAAAAAADSAANRAKAKKEELSLDDISEQSVLVSESADEAPPSGANVILQNRKLPPKKRALEMVLKKKHRGKTAAGAAGEPGGATTSKAPKSPSPSKAQSPTQRAKTMMQNWKMPSPRGWSSKDAGGKGVQAAEASIATVFEEDSEVTHEPGVAENVRTESQSPAKSSIDDVTTSPPQVSNPEHLAPSDEPSGSQSPEITVSSAPKEKVEPAEVESAATESKEAVESEDAVDECPPSEAAALESTEDSERKAPGEGSDQHAMEPTASPSVSVGVDAVVGQQVAPSARSADGDEDDAKESWEGRPLQSEDVQKKQGGDDGEDDDDDDEGEEKQGEPKPFGTYMLLNKQAPSAGKSKVMENILQKKKQAEAKVDASEDGNASELLEGKEAATGEIIPSEAKDLRPQTPEKKPATAAAKSSLEKALKKKSLAKGAAAGATGKQSGLRKPATPKKL